MRYVQLAFACVIALILAGCGAGHPNLVAVNVSPVAASAASNPPADVVYTASGKFANNSSRELTVADGLTWKTSNTVIATINDNGSATCVSHGSVTITGTAPQNLQITVNNGIDNTSAKVSGTATLNCT